MPSFDLSTLDLDVGTHVITARANATGLAQSLDSNSVTFYVYSVTKTRSHCTITTGNISKLYQNTSATLTIAADTGYELPDNITVTGATHTWNQATGTLTLSNPTGNITVTVTAVILLPQLSAPANLTADGTTISFDEVENAEKYEVFADGTSIGEYEVPSGETWVFNTYTDFEGLSATSGFIVTFVCDGVTYGSIHSPDPDEIGYYDSILVYRSGWTDQAYRTVTFETAPTGDLLTWLQANAIKQ